jgi:hypothetical protein
MGKSKNGLVEHGEDGSKELDLAEYCPLPSNLIMGLLIKMHVLQLNPKLNELCKVLHGEVVPYLDLVNPSVILQSLVDFSIDE